MFNRLVIKYKSIKVTNQLHRTIYSCSKTWPKEFNAEVRIAIEKHWKGQLKQHHEKVQKRNSGQKKYYVLSMFPYPSGKLHMGHVRVYTISDVMARYHRLLGQWVIHPMGWDAFGLPAENAAIERGVPPDKWTYSNIESMKTQLEELCCSFDWDREYATCDPNYYKWTQYIFLKMYDNGLVYQKEGAVNWDPVDQTVLADEQVDEHGCSWRSGAKVERKFLKQWYLRTLNYSKSLLDGLSEVDADLWRDIIALQKAWIGPCDGTHLKLQVFQDGAQLASPLNIFTRHPHCVYGISHILLSPEHFYNDKKYYKENHIENNSDIELTIEAINPFTQESLPVYVSKTFDFGMFLDSHLGIPSVNDTDKMFVQQKNINFCEVLDHSNDIINSDVITGLNAEEAKTVILKKAKELSCGGNETSERGRDWLISRQRYWGTPIPMLHCPKYGTMPVPYENLPVELPKNTHLTGKGYSPLVSDDEWRRVKCPKCDCDGFAMRETDTMDTFVDSSWYYLRYVDPHNTSEPFSRDKAHEELPVDLYIGGKEHAIMHLYYTRFFHHFLNDLHLTPTREPFVNLLTQGMVMGKSYRLKETGKYLRKEEIDFTGTEPVEKLTGAAIIEDWEKMSKSKYNGVDPQDMLDCHGTDSTRLCILAGVAPKSDRNWSDDVYRGVIRWQFRIWSLVTAYIEESSHSSEAATSKEIKQWDEELYEYRNMTVKAVNFDMNQTFLLSTAISRLQSLTNLLKKVPRNVMLQSLQYEQLLAELIIMIAPFAPLFASELWEGLRSVSHKCTDFQWDKMVLEQSWPVVDLNYRLKMTVKINNKDKYKVQLPMNIEEIGDLTRVKAIQLAKSDEQYTAMLQGYNPSHIELNVVPGIKVDLNLLVKELKKKKKKKTKYS